MTTFVVVFQPVISSDPFIRYSADPDVIGVFKTLAEAEENIKYHMIKEMQGQDYDQDQINQSFICNNSCNGTYEAFIFGESKPIAKYTLSVQVLR